MNISFNETEKWLKRVLKNKVKIEQKTIINYLMIGVLGLTTGNSLYAAITKDAGTFSAVLLDSIVTNGVYNDSAIGVVSIGSHLEYTDAYGRKASTEASAPLSIAIGLGATAKKVDGTPADSTNPTDPNFAAPLASVAIGTSSTANGYTSTAIGYRSAAIDRSAVAFGAQASAEGYLSTAIGPGSRAVDFTTTAVGANAEAKGKNSVAIGTARHAEGLVSSGEQGILLGSADIEGLTAEQLQGVTYAPDASPWSAYEGVDLANPSQQTGESRASIVSGKNALGIGVAVKAIDEKATAIGYYANASVKDSVALGSNSETTIAVPTSTATISGVTYKEFAGTTPVSVVSVGSAGKERQVQNVAAGQISSTSTDAINGSQLYTVADKLGNEVGSIYFHTNDGTGTQDSGDSVTNKGKITDKAGATGNYSLTAGVSAKAISEGTVAIGNEASAGFYRAGISNPPSGNNAIAIGKQAKAESEDTIAIGRNAKVTLTEKSTNVFEIPLKAIAIGADSKSMGQYNTALGFEATAGENKDQYYSTSIGAKSKVVAGNGTAVGYSANVLADHSVAVGSSATAVGSEAVALGVNANAGANHTTALGRLANASGGSSTVVGNRATGSAIGSQVFGTGAISSARSALAVGHSANSSGLYATAVGRRANATATSAIAIGENVNSSGTNAIAIGSSNKTLNEAFKEIDILDKTEATAENAIAIGYLSKATGTSSIAVGTGNIVSRDNSGAIGNNNYINTSNTYVLGSGIGVKTDKSVFDTVANSVYLGDDSTIAKGATIGTKNLDKEGAVGTTTTAGDTGTVNKATVNEITYGGFAGATAAGAVTVGSAGLERRIMNVAAGEISSTSTDAINGSQLYMVTNHITENSPFEYVDKDGKPVVKIGDKFYPAGTITDEAGTPITVNQDGTTSPATEVTNQGDVVIKAKGDNPENITNIKSGTVTYAGDKNITKVGDKYYNTSDIDPATGLPKTGVTEVAAPIIKTAFDGLANLDVSNPTNVLTVADAKNLGWVVATPGNSFEKPVKNAYKVNFKGDGVNVEGEVDAATNTYNVNFSIPEAGRLKIKQLIEAAETGQTEADVTGAVAIKDNPGGFTSAQTVMDAINGSGWNLQENGTQLGLINPADKINFVNGTGTKVTITPTKEDTKLTAADIKVDIDTVKLETNGDGTVKEVTDSNKIATAQDVVNTINKSGWNATSGTGVNGGEVTGTTKELVNPGETVTFDAGKNMKLVQEGNKFTYATKDDVEFTTVTTKDAAGNTTVINGEGLTITSKDGEKVSLTKDGLDNGGNKITNVAAGDISENSTDAINGSQLYQVTNEIKSEISNLGWNAEGGATGTGVVNNTSKEKVANGDTVKLVAGNNLILDQNGKEFTFSLNKELNDINNISVGKAGKDGVDGTIGVNGKDGSSVVINGKDGTIGLTGPKGTDGKDGANATLSVKDGSKGLDGNNGKDGESKTRIAYETKNPDGTTNTEEVATLNDGLLFTGNNEKVNTHKLNSKVTIKGEGVDKATSEKFVSAAGNINVKADGGDTLEVQLAKDIKGLSTIETKDEAGNTTVTNGEGLTITPKDGEKVSITKDGLNNGGNKITNVAAGKDGTDGVNVSQLRGMEQNINNRIDDLDHSTRRGIAGAMAQAGVKFQEQGVNQVVVGAAASFYRGQGAVAVGVQGAPTENTRVHTTVSATPGRNTNAAITVGGSWKFNIK